MSINRKDSDAPTHLAKILVKIHPKNNRANISGGALLKIYTKSMVRIWVKIPHWPLQPCRRAELFYVRRTILCSIELQFSRYKHRALSRVFMAFSPEYCNKHDPVGARSFFSLVFQSKKIGSFSHFSLSNHNSGCLV